jgi:polar amino acid transport system permease protein
MSGYVLQFGPVLARSGELLGGAGRTLLLTAVTAGLALAIGLLLGFLRGGMKGANRPIAIYVGIIRNTPLLVQIFFLFFGLASIGIKLTSWQAAVLALAIYGGAYMTEIVRSGIDAVARGQIEAGESLGLSRGEIFRHIVFGQAMETVYTALVSQVVIILMVTSLVSVISAPELTHAANGIVTDTFRNFEVYIVTTGIYLVLVACTRIFFALLGLAIFPRRRLRLAAALSRFAPLPVARKTVA